LATARQPSRRNHLPYQVRHLDEIDWETIRWPGETGKMLFHPSPEQPTAPNAGILRLEPGAHHPEHYHGFVQVWFILKGLFTIDCRLCPPGTMLYHPDPYFEGAFHTATGGEILIVQYPGPSTGEQHHRPASRADIGARCLPQDGPHHPAEGRAGHAEDSQPRRHGGHDDGAPDQPEIDPVQPEIVDHQLGCRRDDSPVRGIEGGA